MPSDLQEAEGLSVCSPARVPSLTPSPGLSRLCLPQGQRDGHLVQPSGQDVLMTSGPTRDTLMFVMCCLKSRSAEEIGC